MFYAFSVDPCSDTCFVTVQQLGETRDSDVSLTPT